MCVCECGKNVGWNGDGMEEKGERWNLVLASTGEGRTRRFGCDVSELTKFQFRNESGLPKFVWRSADRACFSYLDVVTLSRPVDDPVDWTEPLPCAVLASLLGTFLALESMHVDRVQLPAGEDPGPRLHLS